MKYIQPVCFWNLSCSKHTTDLLTFAVDSAIKFKIKNKTLVQKKPLNFVKVAFSEHKLIHFIYNFR